MNIVGEFAIDFAEHPGGRWLLRNRDVADEWDGSDKNVVWQRSYVESEDLGEYLWPADMRAEYERLTGKPEFAPQPQESVANIVEMIAGEDCGFDQPCRFGNRVESHAVYCHNDNWLYAPRKCRRTWYTGGERRDEDCPGFEQQVVAVSTGRP